MQIDNGEPVDRSFESGDRRSGGGAREFSEASRIDETDALKAPRRGVC